MPAERAGAADGAAGADDAHPVEDADRASCLARAAYRTRVEWRDTDAGGYHHNTAIARYVESAEAELMRRRGLPDYFGAAPRVRYEADFTAPLWFGQQVTALVALERIGTTSLSFRFEVWGEAHEGEQRRLAAVGRYVTVHVPRGNRHGTPWPEEWVKALHAEPPGEGDATPGGT